MQSLSGMTARITGDPQTEKSLSGTMQGFLYAVVIIALFLLSYLLSGLLTLNVKTKLAGVILITVSMILFLIFKTAPQRIAVSSLLTVALMLSADVIREKTGRKNRSLLIFLYPYFLIMFFILGFIPVSEKPLDWSIVVSAFEKMADRGRKLFSRFDFGIPDYDNAVIGFDTSAELLPGIRKKSREVFDVSFNGNNTGAVYLTGKIYSDFNGKNWEEDTGKDDGRNRQAPERTLDTLETLCAVYETYPDNIRDVLGYREFRITIKDMKTGYAFTPSKIVPGRADKKIFMMSGSEVMFQEKHRYGYSYSVGGYILNRGGTDLTAHLRDISRETWDSLAGRFSGENGAVPDYDDLSKYRNRIGEIYGEKPGLSPETEAFIREIADKDLSENENISDAGKDHLRLLNIEKWLNSHEYASEVNLPSDDIGSGGEFLDYFLFDNTSGFCSYYATAFVLMARSVGIPARYVQGYRIPETELSSVKVMSDMAHAWPEAYIEGAGWIPFEPTPGFKALPAWGEPLMDPGSYMSLKGDIYGIDDINGHPLSENDRGTEALANEEYLREQERLREERLLKRKILATVISLILGVIFLIILIIVFIRLLTREIRFRKMNRSELIIELCHRCFLVLDCLNLRPETGETLPEFRKRAERNISPSGLLMFTEIYERILYDRPDPAAADTVPDLVSAKLKENYASLLKLLNGRKNSGKKIRFLYNIITRSEYRL